MATNKIRKNAIANVIGTFGLIIIAFIMSPFLVNTLGDTKYGIWTIAVSFTGYMNLLDFGITSAVNKYVAEYNGSRDQQKINKIFSTAMILFCVMGVVIVLLSPIMADLVVSLINIDESLVSVVHLLIIIVSFDIGIFVIGGLYKGIFGGYQEYAVINYIQITSAIYKAVMFYLFLSNGFELISMGLVSITANLLSILIFYIVLRRMHPEVRFETRLFSKSSSSKIIHYSKYTFLAMFANQIIFYSDAFVIGYFMSAAAVTYYSIPWALSEYTKKISLAISQTYAPAISEKEAMGDLDHIKILYTNGVKYMIIISNLLSVGMLVLGGAFIAIWMGPKYRELCETVLIILFINQYILGPQLISYAVLKGLAKQKRYSYMSMVVSILNLILSIMLVQKWGIIGVAIGAAIPQVLFHGLYVPWITLKILDMSAWDYFKKTYLLSIIPTFILLATLLLIREYQYPEGYFELLLSASLCTMAYLIAVYYFMLNSNEQVQVNNKISRYLKLA